MLQDFISTALLKHLKHQPTESQKELIYKLSDFVVSTEQDQLFLVKGYAGTGKTTVISALVKALKKMEIKTVLLAPTGRAAKVLSSYAKKQAFTIHKKIYRQKTSSDGMGKFVLDKNLHSNTIFMVDEASMISNHSSELSIFGSGHVLDDLIEYVYSASNAKLILIGDTAQLPPVGLDVSPALSREGLTGYGMDIIEVCLTDVVRQSLESGILCNATQLREMLPSSENNQNFSMEFPKIQLLGFQDIKRIANSELIETIDNAYSKYGMTETMILCRSNKRANRYNEGIRNTILFRENEIAVGDFLMVVKNNYFWLPEEFEETNFIANGDIVEILRIKNYEERYGYRFANVLVKFIDYQDLELEVKIMLDTLRSETPSLSYEENNKLFNTVIEDYQELAKRRDQVKKVKENPYFNALQVKFAYAVTCHKAQGGQWKAIFVDQAYLKDDRIDVEYLRWLYTAVTRSTEMLYLVNFKKEFFSEEE